MTWSGPVDPQLLRTLPTSECAILLLRSLANSGQLQANNMFRGAEQAYQNNQEPDVTRLLEVLSDAWSWLEAHGLIGPDPTQIGGGWQRLTSRGRELAADPSATTTLVAEHRLVMSLHSDLEATVRPIFVLGDFETAAFSAMKTVEIRTRRLAGASDSLVGVKLMRKVFGRDGGTLTDTETDVGEQVATMELFAGAIGAFKNPPSHRTVAYDDATEAAEVILLADLLMRLLDRVEVRLDEDSKRL